MAGRWDDVDGWRIWGGFWEACSTAGASHNHARQASGRPTIPHMRDYIDLTKPRITWLILMSTGIGYFFGLAATAGWQRVPPAPGRSALAPHHARHRADRFRHRRAEPVVSSGRPIARCGARRTGRCLRDGSPRGRRWLSAWRFRWPDLPICGLGVNPLAAWIGAFTLASYLFFYTPLKQRTWWSTTIGAIPGAMPPVIGYAAAAGRLTTRVLGAVRDPLSLAVSRISIPSPGCTRKITRAPASGCCPWWNRTADPRRGRSCSSAWR